MRFLKLFILLTGVQFLNAQVDPRGFDRYAPYGESYVTGFRKDSFFMYYSGSLLVHTGLGTPVADVDMDYLIIRQKGKYGVCYRPIFEKDTLLFAPKFDTFYIEKEPVNYFVLKQRNGKSVYFDTENHLFLDEAPPKPVSWQRTGKRYQDGNGSGSGNYRTEEKMAYPEEIKLSDSESYTHEIFLGGRSFYLHKKQGKYGISQMLNEKSFLEHVPAKFKSFEKLPDADLYRSDFIIFQDPEKELIFWRTDSEGGHIAETDSFHIQIRDENTNPVQHIIYLKRNGKLYSMQMPGFDQNTYLLKQLHCEGFMGHNKYFFHTVSGILYFNTEKPYTPLHIDEVREQNNNDFIVRCGKDFRLLNADTFSFPFQQYKIHYKNQYKMFVQMNVFSPDTVSYLYNYYFIYRVPYQNYQHMDDDLYCYQNSAGKWNVILLQHADTALYAENLPSQPIVYHDKAERPQFQGYSVLFPEDGVSLYNVYGKIILSHISTLHFNPESRLFYGKCRQGEFVAFGGYSDTMNYLLLPPNTKLEHKDRCAFIHAGTKTGYITSQSQIRIPPVYSRLKEINHMLVGEKGGKYYLFGMP